MRWIAIALVVVAAQDPAPAADRLRLALGRVGTADPALAWSPADRRLAEALFGGHMAASGGEELTVVWTLPERTWSDGKPVTAGDYRAAVLRILDPATGSPHAGAFLGLRGAKAYRDGLLLSMELLGYESRSAGDRKAIAARALAGATKRHEAALRDALAAEKDAEAAARLKEALGSAGGREPAPEPDLAATGPRELRAVFEKAGSPVPALGRFPFLPVPQHVIAARPAAWTHPNFLVTCGTHRVEKWVRDEIVLKREGRGPGPEFLELKQVERPAEAWPLWQAGQLDWVEGPMVPPEQLEELGRSGELRSAVTSRLLLLQFGSKGPLAKKAVRLALQRGIGRGTLVEALGPGAKEETGLFGLERFAAPGRDVAAALQVLVSEEGDLAKFPRLNLLTWKDAGAEAAARAVRERLQEDLGLVVRIDARERAAYEPAWLEGDFDLAVAEWSPEPGSGAGAAQAAEIHEGAWMAALAWRGAYAAGKVHVEGQPGAPLASLRRKR